MAKIDDVTWYKEASLSNDGLDHLINGLHIGLYFKWCAINNLLTQEFLADFEEEIEGLKEGTFLIRDFVLQVLDGKLVDDDFTLIGKQFTNDYYSEKGGFFTEFSSFMVDFENLTAGLNLDLEFTDIAPILDDRFTQWKLWRQSYE